MIKTKTENKSVTTKVYICDICKGASSSPSFLLECYICGKDLCRRGTCSVWFETDCDLNIPSCNGDHPDSMCRECWDTGRSCREQIQAIRDAAEKAEEKLWAAWKTEKRIK